MSDVAALLAGIGAMFSGIAGLGTLWFMVRRGSDRENRRTAEVAVKVVADETVTPIDKERAP